jgi:hypothetical protein
MANERHHMRGVMNDHGKRGCTGSTVRRLKGAFFAAAIAFCAWVHPVLAQNLVQNPGFESTPNDGSNTSPGWTLDSTSDTTYVIGEGTAHSGEWAVEFMAADAAGATQGTLSQSITTVPATYYTVSFFLANEGGPHNSFLATFGGQTVLSLTDANAFGYTEFTATVKATSASSVLAFTAQQDPADFLLDDVSVEAGPAPVTGGGLLSIGAAIAGFAARRIRGRGARN